MANYQNILRQAHQAIADVADNADSWRAFLRSAAYTTHYAFPNQALIYSQRPGATMLADIDTWNRAAGRWVNRGARGVASLGTGNMAGNVRYLFDIKDTHPAGKAAKPLGWQITDANRYPTLQLYPAAGPCTPAHTTRKVCSQHHRHPHPEIHRKAYGGRRSPRKR